MNPTRQLAQMLRTEPNITPAHLVAAATAIDTLLDVIEAQRGPVQLTPTEDLEPLRRLRNWHHNMATAFGRTQPHSEMVAALNKYFPPNEQL